MIFNYIIYYDQTMVTPKKKQIDKIGIVFNKMKVTYPLGMSYHLKHIK